MSKVVIDEILHTNLMLFVAIKKADLVDQLVSGEPGMFNFGQLSGNISSIVGFSTSKRSLMEGVDNPGTETTGK